MSNEFITVLGDALGVSDSSVGIAIISLAKDLSLIFSDVIFFGQLIGAIIFIIGFYQFSVMKKPNNQITPKSVGYKLIGGPLMFQAISLYDDATKSIWVSASPATPMGYVAMAESSRETNFWWAVILSLLALVTLFGWIQGLRALYGFATLGDQQDGHRALWTNTWTAVGAILLINITLFLSDVSISMGMAPGAMSTDMHF